MSDTNRPHADRSLVVGVCVFGGLALVVAILLVAREGDRAASLAHVGKIGVEGFPYTRDLHWDVCLALSAVATVLMAARALAARSGRVSRSGVAALLLVLASGFGYFYGFRGIALPVYPHLHDSFHYLLGAKYFDELGYFDLYACAVQADAETTRQIAPSDTVRDLRSYGFVSSGKAAASVDCGHRFGARRWAEFKRDVSGYNRWFLDPGYAVTVLGDHGYNGTPFHTFFAGKLAQFVPVDFAGLGYLALIDVVGLCAMMAVVTWAFGPRVGLPFAIFFFLNFSDRHTFIGGSYLRYLWLVALVTGLALLHRRRYGGAGVLLATSALLNVFPVLFLAGVGIKAVVGWLRDRRLERGYRRFAIACALTFAIGVGLGLAHGKGPKNYRDFVSFIGGHADLLTYSRTGFRYVFLFRGEITTESPSHPYPYARKAQELDRLEPVLWTLAGLALIASLAVASRLDDVEAAILAGFSLFFFLFGTVEYYYAVAAVLVLLWHRRARGPTGALFLAGLFALMTVAWVAWDRTGLLVFCNNTVMSVLLASYLFSSIAWLGFETGLWRDLRRWIGERLRRPRRARGRRFAFEAIVVLSAAIVTPLGVTLSWAQFGEQWAAVGARGSTVPGCVVSGVPEQLRIEPREFGPLRLVGRFARPTPSDDRTVTVVSYWELREETSANLEILLELVADGSAIGGTARTQSAPCGGDRPTSRWRKGETYRTHDVLRLPPEIPVGPLGLRFGVRDGQRTIGTDWTLDQLSR